MDLVVIGAGLFGLSVARMAAEAGLKVSIIDKREHIGGNAYSYMDPKTGIEIHKYGSHLFHTSNPRVWEFANRFTTFTSYVHRVFTRHKNQIYPMPINLATINQFYHAAFSPAEARSHMQQLRNFFGDSEALNLEEKAISVLGVEMYEAFIKGYTQKQWQTDPKLLPIETISRIPIRYDYNSRYFDDKWEGLPVDGYSAWFDRMLDHHNINVHLNTDFFAEDSLFSKSRILGQVKCVYTGPIDRYFNYELGILGWRTLTFELDTLNLPDFQGTSVMNYADLEFPFTRIHELKHLHPERSEVFNQPYTVIMKEFSKFANQQDEPYYPINSPSDRQLLLQYRSLIAEEARFQVFFGGRLGSYQYLDMHMAIASAMKLSNQVLGHDPK